VLFGWVENGKMGKWELGENGKFGGRLSGFRSEGQDVCHVSGAAAAPVIFQTLSAKRKKQMTLIS